MGAIGERQGRSPAARSSGQLPGAGSISMGPRLPWRLNSDAAELPRDPSFETGHVGRRRSERGPASQRPFRSTHQLLCRRLRLGGRSALTPRSKTDGARAPGLSSGPPSGPRAGPRPCRTWPRLGAARPSPFGGPAAVRRARARRRSHWRSPQPGRGRGRLAAGGLRRHAAPQLLQAAGGQQRVQPRHAGARAREVSACSAGGTAAGGWQALLRACTVDAELPVIPRSISHRHPTRRAQGADQPAAGGLQPAVPAGARLGAQARDRDAAGRAGQSPELFA